jgi:hypothetical protein
MICKDLQSRSMPLGQTRYPAWGLALPIVGLALGVTSVRIPVAAQYREKAFWYGFFEKSCLKEADALEAEPNADVRRRLSMIEETWGTSSDVFLDRTSLPPMPDPTRLRELARFYGKLWSKYTEAAHRPLLPLAPDPPVPRGTLERGMTEL